MGFNDFRVRSLQDTAKIELKRRKFYKIVDNRERMVELFKAYFKAVVLDLKGR